MTSTSVVQNNPAWQALRERLRILDGLLSPETVHSLDAAKAFAAAAQAMLAAMESAGASSMRFEAVVKALDLKTPKSALAAFLGRG